MAARFLSPAQLARFEEAYRRWGFWLLILNRFFPGVRGFLFLAAGASGIPVGRAHAPGRHLGGRSGTGCCWRPAALVARNLDELVALVDRYTRVAGTLVGLVLLAVLVRALWKRRSAGGDRSPGPCWRWRLARCRRGGPPTGWSSRGEPVGLVTLEVRCAGAGCQVHWLSRQRLPVEAGGGVQERRVELEVDAEGRALGPAQVTEDGVVRQVVLPRGAVPALLLEPLLAGRLRASPEACLDAVDELSGVPLRACGRREAGRLRLDLGTELEWVKPGADGFADEVVLPAQRTRFVRDPGAALPAGPPSLFEVEVAGPARAEQGASFCGVRRDPAPGGAPAGLPAPKGEGANCREQAAAWLQRARAGGWRGRTAVGVAWSGAAWSWHAWAEVRVGERWVAVDPSFHQAPARSARFTLATWEEGDEPARAEAGRRILGCWGRAGVEP